MLTYIIIVCLCVCVCVRREGGQKKTNGTVAKLEQIQKKVKVWHIGFMLKKSTT